MNPRFTVVLFILMALAVASCGINKPAPDLERMYRSAREDHHQPPVILIPGILGTRLADAAGREVWLGSSDC